MDKHLSNHIKHQELRSDNTLHVIGVISNPVRYHSRYRLFKEWYERMKNTPNTKVYVVETAYGDRHHEVTEKGHPNHLQLRTNSEIWIKENMINLAVRDLLPRDWKYVAWVDCDVEFSNPNWALDTIHQLQHYAIVQPWQSAINLGPDGEILKSFDSVGYKNYRGKHHCDKKYTGDPYIFGHCGYAWACTRAFWENVGSLIEVGILGSSDHHMALGCCGYYSHSVHSAVKGSFMDICHDWQTRAMQLTHGIIGFTVGHLKHYFHGSMGRRQYVNRWNILIEHGFDPKKDLMRDAQGLIKLCGKPRLEHAIRLYNRDRLEDSIEK
jgi:hypothetical protein